MRNTMLLFFLFLSHLIVAQNVMVMPEIESTIIGTQYGGVVGFTSKQSFSLGVFYLTSKKQPEVWPKVNSLFYGIYTAVPLVYSTKIVFSGSIRAGLSNNRFVVVVPGVETRVKINAWAQCVTGLSWRYGHAAIHAGLMVKL